jgi:hypothetical protein
MISRRAASLFWLAALAPPAAADDGETKAVLHVYISGRLPGFPAAEAVKFVAAQMMKPYVGRWSFAPGRSNPKTELDRVEWRFEEEGVASGLHILSAQLRLFLGGHYQALVFDQASIAGGPKDAALAHFLVQMTEDLLGLNGAYHAIDRRWKALR